MALTEELFKKHVTITDLIHGPFVIVVSSLEDPNDDAYPMVVSPPGGYPTKEAALEYIERFGRRKTPYLGLHFAVVKIQREPDLIVFCSWED